MTLAVGYKRIRENFNSASDVLLFSRIFFAYFLIPLLFSLLPLPFLMRILTPKRKMPAQEDKISRIIKYADFISLKLNRIFKATCLRKSLVLYRFLSAYDPGLTFHLGITSDKKSLRGHSWLTSTKKTLLLDRVEAGTFKKIYSYSRQNWER